MFENLVSMFGLAAVFALHVVASSGARWAVARGYGVRGAGLSLGFGKRWSLVGPRRHLARVGIAAGGLVASYLVAVLLLAVGTVASGRLVIDETSMRVTVAKGGPAAHAGIEDGDRILAVDDELVADWDGLKRAVGRHPAEGIDVLVERGGEQKHVRVVPNVSGKMQVGPPSARARVGFGEALVDALGMPFEILAGTARALVRVVVGAERAELSGPVGIVAESARSGAGDVLKLLGALSAYVLPFIAVYNFWAAPGVVSRRGTSVHESPVRR